MQIAFAGDIYVPHYLDTVPTFGPKLLTVLEAVDEFMLNFEGPLDQGANFLPTFKTGPNLRQHSGALRYLTQSGVTAVGLANNHAADFGESALKYTSDRAGELGLQVAGVWQDDQYRFVEWHHSDLSVRVLAFAEEEWGGSSKESIRIALLDLFEAARLIAEAKRSVDVVVVNLHGNNEHSPLPNPTFARQARFLVDCGADCVVVHHAHRISGLEIYLNRPIFYGLGNFQFCTPEKNAHWHEGLLAVLKLERTSEGVMISPSMYPISVNPLDYTVELASPDRAKKLSNDVAAMSQIITSPASLEAHFEDFVAQSAGMYDEFLNPFSGGSRLARLLGRAWVRHIFLKNRRHAMLINALRCDSHRLAMTRHLVRQLEKR